MPKRKVSFDRYNRTLVDGKLFFPLGMYWLGINQADINIYTNAPFNCLMPYSKTDIAQLDICEAAGIKVLFPVHKGYDELDKAEKFIDDAAVSSLKNVTIVHGKGTGALRQAVHDFLKSNPCVEEYRIGKYGEGDLGVTIAELK